MRTVDTVLQVALSIAVFLIIGLSFLPEQRTAIAGNCGTLCPSYCKNWWCYYTNPNDWRNYYPVDCSANCRINCADQYTPNSGGYFVATLVGLVAPGNQYTDVTSYYQVPGHMRGGYIDWLGRCQHSDLGVSKNVKVCEGTSSKTC